MSHVKATDLVKRYGSLEVVHGVSFTIADGEFVVLVGESGCGKSTVLRMIAGLEEITGGTLSIDGEVVNDFEPRDRGVAMVFQDYALYPHLRVRDNIGFGLEVAGVPKPAREERIAEIAGILQLSHLLARYPRELSGGQRQRVAMGRALIRDPGLFLFDEPLSNLDAKLRSQMRAEIKRLHKRLGTTMIYVTHDQVEAMTLADRIICLREGRIAQAGTPAELYGTPANVFVAQFIGSPPMNLFPARVVREGDAVRLVLEDGTALPLPDAPSRALRGLADRALTVGVRAENFTDAPGPESLSFVLPVEITEPLGPDTLVHTSFGGGKLIARVAPHALAEDVAEITLHLDLTRLHLFDAASGERIAANGATLP